MNDGWVKLHRSVLDSDWLRQHNAWILWTYILLKASHKRYKTFLRNTEIVLEPGMLVFSIRTAAEDTGLTPRKVRTALDLLAKAENLTQQVTHCGTVITIRNWREYQGDGIEDNTADNTAITQLRHSAHNIEDNNVKYVLNNIFVEIRKIQDLWNQHCSFAPIRRITNGRSKKLHTRMQSWKDLKTVETIFRKIGESDFLSGKTGDWKATFDWVVKNDENAVKVLEGNYDNKGKPQTTASHNGPVNVVNGKTLTQEEIRRMRGLA